MIETVLHFIFTLIFIFSVVNIVRLIVLFMGAVFSNPPKKLELANSALIFHGISLSYIITFTIFLLS
jgi:hypothetical protein